MFSVQDNRYSIPHCEVLFVHGVDEFLPEQNALKTKNMFKFNAVYKNTYGTT
jgi:hypothetical protein